MVRFQYPRTGLDFQCRNPNMGNTNTLEFSRINRKTLGGDNIIFSDPQWPVNEVVNQTFDLPLCDSNIALLRKLIIDSVADYFTYTDFCGNEYNALIRNPSTAITQPSKNSQTITLELEIS